MRLAGFRSMPRKEERLRTFKGALDGLGPADIATGKFSAGA